MVRGKRPQFLGTDASFDVASCTSSPQQCFLYDLLSVIFVVPSPILCLKIVK